jgi:HAD superfamily hydrolase (TIGR01549 family)
VKPEAVILDVDGTLVDSNDAHARAWVDALAERGNHVPFPEVRRLIGMGGDKLLPRVAGIAADGPEGKAISARRQEIFLRRYLPLVGPFPCTRELLERIRADGMTLVVASSAKEEELRPLLEIAGASGLVEDTVSSDDAKRSKPDPDIVRAALAKTGRRAEEVVMIGDTPYDLEAARRAGVGFVAVRCGGWDDEAFPGALAVYDDPADLLARYDGSPLSGA